MNIDAREDINIPRTIYAMFRKQKANEKMMHMKHIFEVYAPL